MRSLNELYKILLSHWELNTFDKFIYNNINAIEKNEIVSEEEAKMLKAHFDANKPTKTLHTEFFNHPDFVKEAGMVVWWSREKSSEKKPFLLKMIAITDERTPLQKLNDKIEQENELFKTLSKAQQRVKIAEDCLVRIELEQLKPDTNSFAAYASHKLAGKSIKETLNTDSNAVCHVCAKGGLFMSYIGRVNNFIFEGGGGFNNNDENSAHKALLEIFSYPQLALIELAFEGTQYMHSHSILVRNYHRAIKFWKKYGTSSKRLEAICQNIIHNKGTFKL